MCPSNSQQIDPSRRFWPGMSCIGIVRKSIMHAHGDVARCHALLIRSTANPTAIVIYNL